MDGFIGVISKVKDPDKYLIEVNIPGKGERYNAFPLRGEVDEPRVGDIVFLRELDPTFNSYYLYEKLKENSFIGIRSRGKLIKITKEEITIGIFPTDDNNNGEGNWYDDNSGNDKTPKPSSYIKIDSSGNIEVKGSGAKLDVSGDFDIKISGSAKLDISGNAEINSPNVSIKGGSMTVNGNVAPTGSGPFCGIPTCPFTGLPHVGNKIVGT